MPDDVVSTGELAPDVIGSALSAGLHYVSHRDSGIRRMRYRDGFRYISSVGKPVRDAETLARIRSLAIPPAWEDVWICPSQHGHLQATGRDAKGRRQYRYHTSFREERERTKFDHLVAFAKSLPAIRTTVDEHLRLRGLPRQKVLATVASLLEATLIRIGNDEYARANKSFGLTTLLNRHVTVEGSEMRFVFRARVDVCGKSRRAIRVSPASCVRVRICPVRRCCNISMTPATCVT